MQPEIRTIADKKLTGMRMSMSLAGNKTGELWASFVPRQKEIANRAGTDRYSLQVYPPDYFSPFNPADPFTKWAAVEVTSFDAIPEGMESFVLPGGMYAVFLYKGSSARAAEVFGYIYGTWLPASGYRPDNRPHFEILGERYRNNDEASEEEIWIPVIPV